MKDSRETFGDRPVYTLTEISKSLRSVIGKNYPNAYYIKAEVVRLNYYPHSGHCYPELAEKEGNQIKTQMRAIIWASNYKTINDQFVKITGDPLKEGLNILCLATIEYDVKYGLSLHIQDIEPTYTMGDMIRNKLQVIERLKQEKIFMANKEKVLPLLPKRIAVISVETSKGYGDFLVTLDNNPYKYKFKTSLFPSILQGDKAITTITTRLTEIEQELSNYDCVVIIRGGGGDVGLSCYDDYSLASRVATFPLPVIVGIGHSTNVTITDMVAFQSKITPTDVANFFIERFREVDTRIEECKKIMQHYSKNLVREAKSNLQYLEQNKRNVAVKRIALERNRLLQLESSCRYQASGRINKEKNRLEQLFGKLNFAITRVIAPRREQLDHQEKLYRYLSVQLLNTKREELSHLETKVELLHPDNVLKRGYSITYFEGKALTDSSNLKSKDVITTKLFDGEIISIVE